VKPLRPADLRPADLRPRSLDRLERLVGQWNLESSFRAGQLGPDTPATVMRGGRTTFEWMDGGAFLIQRFTSTHAAPLSGTVSGMAVIGPVTDTEADFTQHYYDSRGVARVYHMTLEGDLWTLSREAPGFCQRYLATISPDSTVMTGAWEKSADRHEWEYDFGLTYRKIR
jgi:hypothetical protein